MLFRSRDPGFSKFFKALEDLLRILLPRFEDEGKSDVTIAIGCTGGRHRSVYVAEKIGQRLAQRGLAVTVRHRDLDGAGESDSKPDRRVSRKSSRRGKVS